MTRTLALATAVAAALSAPAFAGNADFVIDHVNMSAEGSEVISVGPNGPVLGTTVSTMGDSALAQAIEHFNASKDASQRIDANTVTVFSGEPAYAADIFEQLRAADDES